MIAAQELSIEPPVFAELLHFLYTDSCPPSLELDDTEPGGGEAAAAAGAEREREQAQSPGSTEMAQHLCEPSFRLPLRSSWPSLTVSVGWVCRLDAADK